MGGLRGERVMKRGKHLNNVETCIRVRDVLDGVANNY
jgi:hypothetical protein